MVHVNFRDASEKATKVEERARTVPFTSELTRVLAVRSGQPKSTRSFLTKDWLIAIQRRDADRLSNLT